MPETKKRVIILSLFWGLLCLLTCFGSLSSEAWSTSSRRKLHHSAKVKAKTHKLKKGSVASSRRRVKRSSPPKKRVRQPSAFRGRRYSRRSSSYRGLIRRRFPLSPLPPVKAGKLLLGTLHQGRWFGLAPVDLQGQVQEPEVGILWTQGNCQLTYYLEGKYRRLHGHLRVLKDFPEDLLPLRVRCQIKAGDQVLYDTGWLRPGEERRFFLNLTQVEKLQLIVQPEEGLPAGNPYPPSPREIAIPTVEWKGLALW